MRIHVLDDGQPSRRLSRRYPEEARRVNELIETEFDIGISAGRNRLLETVKTPFFLLIDDDHVVTPNSNIETLVARLSDFGSDCDLLAALSDDRGQPRCFHVDESKRILYASHRSHRVVEKVAFCDFVPNTFVARAGIIREIGWDESLKVHEHWEFFYRAWQRGLRVAITPEHSFDHRHLHNPSYNHLRRRSWYMRRGLQKHGLRRFAWTSPPEET